MLKSAQNGSINAFVIEHQAFDAQKLESQFVFVPFGMRHDYPLYQMPDVTEKETEVEGSEGSSSTDDNYILLEAKYISTKQSTLIIGSRKNIYIKSIEVMDHIFLMIMELNIQ